ncbi:MAG: hypothetical protein M1831_003002 [Alyxoria varia]|nr:MAG: hypothetical protein M1831_003002 [Alyxoria varia]
MPHAPHLRDLLPLILLTLTPLATSTLHSNPPAPDAIFDYIIIGGGTAGLPLALRLSQPSADNPPAPEEQNANNNPSFLPANPNPAKDLAPKGVEDAQQHTNSTEAPTLGHQFDKRRFGPATNPLMPDLHPGDLLITDPDHPGLHLDDDEQGDGGKGSGGPTVAVLEAGQSESDNPVVTAAASVAGFGKAFGTRLDWGYESQEQVDMGGGRKAYYAGKGLGGTTLINGQTYLRPHHAQIDAWQDVLGNEGWNWESLFPYYLRSEQFQKALPAQEDVDGPVRVGWMENLAPFEFFKRVRDTYSNLGFRHIDDANNGDPAGFSVWPLTLQRESDRRWDAASAYLPPTMEERENLDVFQNVTVSRIVWEETGGGENGGEKKAKGVEYETKDGEKMFVGVKRDVIVSAGSLRSPAILEQSGVGNPSILSKLKVPVEVELPSLGFNLQDQVLFSVMHNSTLNITGFTPYVTTVTVQDLFGKDLESIESRVRDQIPKYARQNVDSSAAASTTTEIQEKLLNLQTDLMFKKNVPCAEILTQAYGENIGSTAWGLLPFSRGHAHAAPGNSSKPDIDPKLFMLEWDRTLSVATAKLARKALETKPFADISKGEFIPGKKLVPDGASDEEWLKYLKQGYSPNYHPIGSAPMMSRELGGVVDAELRVYGTQNVRVVDASVLPFQVVGHLMSTIYAVAEKAADVIKKTPYQDEAPAPDGRTTRYEDKVVNNLDLSRLSLGPSKPNPMRPGYGSRGEATVLWTNSFDLNLKPDLKIHKYVISIQEEPIGRKKRRLVQQFIDANLDDYRDQFASDYSKTLISLHKFPERTLSAKIKHQMEDEEHPSPRASTHQVNLTLERTVSFQQLLDLVRTENTSINITESQYLLQILNIVMAHTIKSKSIGLLPQSVSQGNRHYPLTSPTAVFFDLGKGLLAARGMAMSVRPAAMRVICNIQPKHLAIYEAEALPVLMFKHVGVDVGDTNALRRLVRSGSSKVKSLNRFLNPVRVDATHLTRKRKSTTPTMKQIHGLATPTDGRDASGNVIGHPPQVPGLGASAHEVKFFYQPRSGAVIEGLEPGSYISVAEFFAKAHDFRAAKDLPVVNVGKKANPVYLPAEVCTVLQGQPASQVLSPDQTANMIKFAVRPPMQNAQTVAHRSKRALDLESSALLNDFTAELGAQMLTVPARVLPAPQPIYGHKKGPLNVKDGSWNLVNTKAQNDKGMQLLVPAALKDWGVVSVKFGDQKESNWRLEASNVVKAFARKLRDMGMSVEEPTVRFGECDVTIDKEEPRVQQTAMISNLFDKAKAKFSGRQPRFFLVIIPKEDSIVYSAVKICSEIREGFQTQVVVATKFVNMTKAPFYHDAQTLANIGLKVNLKLGGSNHTLEDSQMVALRKGKFMLMGLDVTHPSPGSKEDAPSVVGVVASVDHYFSRYPGALHAQRGTKEIAEALTELTKGRLDLWRKQNKSLPDNILIFRDGVSEGQHSLVLQQELPQIQEAIQQTYPEGKRPRITLIISVKRHTRRFYPTDATFIDRSNNPRNGTIVDRHITQPQFWDFYLKAHTAIHGTAIFGHYYVLYDEIFTLNKNLKDPADELEQLVHNLCYMYGRATKAVSLAPPAYFADLLCERARKYLAEFFNPDFTSEDTSTHSSSTTYQAKITPQDNIQNTMFYV